MRTRWTVYAWKTWEGGLFMRAKVDHLCVENFFCVAFCEKRCFLVVKYRRRWTVYAWKTFRARAGGKSYLWAQVDVL